MYFILLQQEIQNYLLRKPEKSTETYKRELRLATEKQFLLPK